MRIALIEPDMLGNVGTMLRLAACFGAAVELIEPCGFAFSDRALKRAGMDYVGQAKLTRHADWSHFQASVPGRRILLTTSGAIDLWDADFAVDDVLLVGAESRGAPDHVRAAADLRVRIPLQPGLRSLNVAVAAGIALAEAIRQTRKP
jgi:tRNA (cytidine/uridine-2'-O-)-methyltransferase